MIDLLLLAGSALCVISIIMAIAAVAQTRAPRGAAVALIMGFILLFAAAWMQPAAVNPKNMLESWQRLLTGQLSLQGGGSAPAAPDIAQ